NKNFASTFPVLDLIFGTFYMPHGKLPERYGTGDPAFPEDFMGQLAYPFRKARPTPPTVIEQHRIAALPKSAKKRRTRKVREQVSQGPALEDWSPRQRQMP